MWRRILAGLVSTSFVVSCSGGEAEPRRELSIDQGEALALTIAQRMTLSATVDVGATASQAVTWSSDDPAIVSVDDEGTITAAALGVTYVRATSVAFDDVSDVIGVTVESVVPISAVAGGYHVLALDARGGVWGWGSNAF